MPQLLSCFITNYRDQGDSISRAFEYIYQSAHLNIRENVNSYGGQMLLQSTLYSRLGIPHLADVHCELLLDCHGASCPIDEKLRAVGRQAFIVRSPLRDRILRLLTSVQTSQNGRYEAAVRLFDSVDITCYNTSLKFDQYLTLCVGIIKLKRAIRRQVPCFVWQLSSLDLTTVGLTGQPARIY